MKALSQQSEHPRLNINLKLKTRSSVLRTPNRAGSESSTAETWPPIQEWARRQQTLAAKSFRRLGVGPERTDNGVWSSQALSVLGPGSFAEFTAVRTSGKVMWCNFELARQLGFEVPQSNKLTPEFDEQLLAALSFRAAKPGEDLGGQETVMMYADKYGGDGVSPALGAGRAGFLTYGNLYVKGIGFTPLFKHNDPDDFAHSHGGVHLDDCLTEAIFGEVNENLFEGGSARVLAIIDQSEHVTAPSGRRIPVALVVRAGAQLRPAHLLGSHSRSRRSRLDKFVSITRSTGQIVARQTRQTGRDIPDIQATMLRIIDDHARTAAESFRWRMIHGALTASNMEMSGAMLDLPTQSTQPRTAPIRVLDYVDHGFGAEHTERAIQLRPMYSALIRRTSQAERDRFNVRSISIADKMQQAYRRHLQVKLLSAAGLKSEVAQRIQTERTELAVSFTDLILRMVALKNPGTTRAWRSTVESVSVLDVFHLLQRLPETYFTSPEADHSENIRDYLKPVFRGNRFHIAKKQDAVRALAREFADLYNQLMKACADYAPEYYGDLPGMRASIKTRAAFENEPLDSLYSKKLLDELAETIATYKSTGDPEIVRAAIDQRITASMRSVDGLFAQGSCDRLPGGGIELERRTIDGVGYSVRAWNDAAQTRRLHVSISVQRAGSCYSSAIWNLPHLTKRQIQLLRYRFTTDRWKTSADARARLKRAGRNGFTIDFEDLVSVPMVGRLEGTFYFHGLNDLTPQDRTCSSAYVFAIPDKQELLRLVTGSVNGSNHQEG